MKTLLSRLLLWTEDIPDNLLAKSDLKSKDRLLKKHTKHVIENISELLERYRERLDSLATKNDLSIKRIEQAALIIAATHDLGKGTIRFQRVLNSGQRDYEYFHHALASFALTNLVTSGFRSLHSFDENVSIEGLVVISHHHKLDANLFGIDGDGRDHTRDRIDWSLSYDILTLIKSLISKLNGVISEEKLNHLWNTFLNGQSGIIRDWYACADFVGNALSNPEKELFIFLKGLLISADWLASGGYRNIPPIVKPQLLLMEEGKALYFHQKEAAECKGHLFAKLPTGTGKTELALNWAVSQGKNKLIFLLPTTSTTNQTYFRLRRRLGLFEQGIAGLLHGSVKLQSEVLSKGQVDIGNGFNLTYTVATIDQALLAFLNYGHWELKRVNLQNAAVVIDEIHSYRGYTLALVTRLIEYLTFNNSRVCLMSATFPNVYVEHLSTKLGMPKLITLHQEIKPKCCYIGYLDNNNELWKKVLFAVNNKKKVLMISNTVEGACTLYRKAKDMKIDNVQLLHSQFTLKDRLKKEKSLGEEPYPNILISTQVVEVGIDIDFDLLFSEVCPMPGLIQRMGRVNRLGIKDTAEIYLFHPSCGSDNIYKQDELSYTLKNLEKFKEVLLTTDIIDELVNGSVSSLTDSEYQEGIILLKRIENNKGIAHVQDNEDALTRKNEYLKIEVIPVSLYNEARECETLIERTQFLVKIPLWWLTSKNIQKCNDASTELGLTVVNMDYSAEEGAKKMIQSGVMPE